MQLASWHWHALQQSIGKRASALPSLLNIGSGLMRPAKTWVDLFEQLPPIQPKKDGPRTRAVWHAQLDSHQKPIQLRFGQWKCSRLILRILCCDDKKRLRQFVSDAVGRDLMFFH